MGALMSLVMNAPSEISEGVRLSLIHICDVRGRRFAGHGDAGFYSAGNGMHKPAVFRQRKKERNFRRANDWRKIALLIKNKGEKQWQEK